MIIQIIGLPGAGKSTLASKLAEKLNATHLNGAEVRKESNNFDASSEGRVKQAARMRELSQVISDKGKTVIADFVNPTKATRAAFGKADFTVWMDRYEASTFLKQTDSLWEEPTHSDIRIPDGFDPDQEVDFVIHALHGEKNPDLDAKLAVSATTSQQSAPAATTATRLTTKAHYEALPKLPHTYRQGLVLMTIKAAGHDDANRLWILDAEATYDGNEVDLPLPFVYVNPPATSTNSQATKDNTLLFAVQEMVAETVKQVALS